MFMCLSFSDMFYTYWRRRGNMEINSSSAEHVYGTSFIWSSLRSY